jgi:hypothetical protein
MRRATALLICSLYDIFTDLQQPSSVVIIRFVRYLLIGHSVEFPIPCMLKLIVRYQIAFTLDHPYVFFLTSPVRNPFTPLSYQW